MSATELTMRTTTATAARPWRLGARTRKAVLVLHIAASGGWIGLDVVMAVFVFTSMLTDDLRTKAVCYQALELFAFWPMIVVGLLCLASGVLLGLGTKYGLLRYWWVAVKLGLNLVLTTLAVVSLRPGVAEVAEHGRSIAAGGTDLVPIGDLIFPPIVSPTALLLAVVLSLYRPWAGSARGDRSR